MVGWSESFDDLRTSAGKVFNGALKAHPKLLRRTPYNSVIGGLSVGKPSWRGLTPCVEGQA